MLLTLLAMTYLSVNPVSAGGPTFIISQDSGHVGDVVTVSGEGYEYNSVITIEVFKFETRTDDKGAFNDKLTIPGDGLLTAGTYEVIAADPKGNEGYAKFTMLPSIVLTPSAGPAGSVIHVHGDCFPGGKNDYLNVTFDERVLLAETYEHPLGVLDIDVTIPDWATIGPHTIRATTFYGDTATATFNVVPSFQAPEYPIGALLALFSSIAALVTFKQRHRLRVRREKFSLRLKKTKG